MSDTIYREDAIKAVEDGMCTFYDCYVLDRINAIPSADRPQGEWIFVGDNMFQCTSCGEVYSTRQFEMMRNRTTDPLFPKGCPHCGARMKGADDE